MITYLWVAVGSALGGVTRFGLSSMVDRASGGTFPWGTLVVNVTGCFVIGFFATLTGPNGRFMAPPDLRQFFMVGVCGGYTTFSSFGLQTLNLVRDGEIVGAGGNVAGSIVLCLLGVWLGYVCAALINRARGA